MSPFLLFHPTFSVLTRFTVQCSVWPGFFTQGAIWPQQGEIDIIENVNLATSNQYALHVGYSPCNQPSTGVNQTGKPNGLNCTVEPLLKINTAGCVVVESQPNSFGQGFANNNGGVYAMLWDEDGVAIWFFPRQSIPSDISASGNTPNPSGWGTPSAFYPASGCNPTAAFGPQIITFVRLSLSRSYADRFMVVHRHLRSIRGSNQRLPINLRQCCSQLLISRCRPA